MHEMKLICIDRLSSLILRKYHIFKTKLLAKMTLWEAIYDYLFPQNKNIEPGKSVMMCLMGRLSAKYKEYSLWCC